MADWLRHAAPRTPGRRLAFALSVLAVAALHGWLASTLQQLRLDWGAASAMPERLQVVYARELALAEPARPSAAPATKPRLPKRIAAAASEPASAPERTAHAPEVEATLDLPVETGQPLEAASVEAAASEPRIAEAAASAASAPAPFEWPASTRLSYVLTGNYRGEINGNAQVEWIRQGSHYQVNLDVAVGPSFMPLIARHMTSGGELGEQGLRPLRYDEDTKVLFRERRRVSVLFQGAQVVLANGRRESAAPGTQDSASQFVQLTWLFLTQREQLELGRVIAMPLALPRKLHAWRYEVIGDETLETPMGPVQAWRLKPQQEAGGGDLTAEVWIAPQLQYLPVRLRIQQDAHTFVDLMLKAAPQQAAP